VLGRWADLALYCTVDKPVALHQRSMVGEGKGKLTERLFAYQWNPSLSVENE
jgi:hypothetical protein